MKLVVFGDSILKGVITIPDSGKLFDITDPDLHIAGLSSMFLSGLMESHREKAHLVTTGYNRNMIRFSREPETARGEM